MHHIKLVLILLLSQCFVLCVWKLIKPLADKISLSIICLI